MRVFLIVGMLLVTTLAQAQAQLTVGHMAAAPLGWRELCEKPQYQRECYVETTPANVVVLTGRLWNQLQRVNTSVNEKIRPITDMDHWGLQEQWNFAEDGYGDCEDYVLLKRRELMQLGWPRETLLITVVREQNGNGHAVLTVVTNKGEFILDNQNPEILRWDQVPYGFDRRQSQTHPNLWVALIDPRTVVGSVGRR